MSLCTAIIPYTPPIAPEEFIRREAERAKANTVISEQPVLLARQPFLSKLFRMNFNTILIGKFGKLSCTTFKFTPPLFDQSTGKLSSRMTTLKFTPLLFAQSTRIASAAKLDGDKIAEALQSEAAFTIATDPKPIVATYGCTSCVAIGGFDPTNKIAFVVHFANPEEVTKSENLIFYNISKLVKNPITTPIQLHLRGGIEGQSEAIIEAIKVWMKQRKDLPMEIVSEDILGSSLVGSKSLSIDSRTGKVSSYAPLANPKSRETSELDAMRAMISAFEPRITLAYSPK